MTHPVEWCRAISSSFVPLRVENTDVSHFAGSLGHTDVDGVGWTSISADAHTVVRDPSSVDSPYYKVSMMLSGSGLLIQDGREAILQPGDFAIYDAGMPYTLEFSHHFESLVLMFDRSILDLPVNSVRELTAVTEGARGPLGRIVSPMLKSVGQDPAILASRSAVRVTRSLLDLIGTVYSEELGTGTGRLAAVRRYIECNLHDPRSNPTTVAAALFMSTRQLHNLFSAAGVPVSEWIRERRLEHRRRDLSDQMQSARTIGSIGSRWGLDDPALSHGCSKPDSDEVNGSSARR